ncbi:MRG/MORF4L-binding protein isoform X2 [Protopterus annectens]|uniref:MRG/MORF4L-binding protein isoform X2 n=1 Tax=Protopterus annectens TaxID=7888 RepID=UPI001CFB4AEA|nr:MRG/MORF4L-binding protein isoform X2 [Protopterus annectens]
MGEVETAAPIAVPEGGGEQEPPEEPVSWSPEVEVCLFHAMLGHKPVGVNRHFHMICIRDKFSQNIGRQVSSKVIWDHLGTMYDMQALHESEILPFPNLEKNFNLPDEIFQSVREGIHSKVPEKNFTKERDKSSADGGSKEAADKRKRNRVTEKVATTTNSGDPSSPSAAKRRRT